MQLWAPTNTVDMNFQVAGQNHSQNNCRISGVFFFVVPSLCWRSRKTHMGRKLFGAFWKSPSPSPINCHDLTRSGLSWKILAGLTNKCGVFPWWDWSGTVTSGGKLDTCLSCSVLLVRDVLEMPVLSEVADRSTGKLWLSLPVVDAGPVIPEILTSWTRSIWFSFWFLDLPWGPRD